MNQPEKKFNSWIRNMLPGDYMRVENSAMYGVPDINVCLDGKELWIESKIFYPKHGSPLLEPEQHAWGYRRTTHGGRAWILALDESTELIHAYKHRLTVEPAASKYLAILSAAVHYTHPKRGNSDMLIRTLFYG